MHSSSFRHVAFCAFLMTFHLQAGLEDLSIFISPDGKQFVILAGDNHMVEPGSQTERLAAAIAKCQKNDPSPMEVYIEMPATLFVKSWPVPRILTDLEPLIKSFKIPQVATFNAEIRNTSILAFWLFHKEYPREANPTASFECANKECIIGRATLQDLDNEFADIHSSLSAFVQAQVDPLQFRLQCYLDMAQKQLVCFQKLVERHKTQSNTILETAIAVTDYDNCHPEEKLKSKLAQLIFNPFAVLFDLNMLRKIFSSTEKKQLILAGLLHTRAIRDFLFNSEWKILPDSVADQIARNADDIYFDPITQIKAASKL